MPAVIETPPGAPEPGVFTLQQGPHWRSFDRFKKLGPRALIDALPEGHVGQLNAKEYQFIIVRAETWNQVYGLARDVSRFQRGILLVRHAAKLLFRVKEDPEGLDVAFDLLRDLTFQLPNLPTGPAPTRELDFSADERVELADDDEGFELDPTRVERPDFGTDR
jgi:hypothetical protein